MRKRDLNIDVFKGRVNTFFTIKHKNTGITVAHCVRNEKLYATTTSYNTHLKVWIAELQKKVDGGE